MYQGSTIRPKIGICALCDGNKKQHLTKGFCQMHYWQQNKLKSVQKWQEKEISSEPGLPELIKEADDIFSRYVRLSAADSKGIVSCFICGEKNHYKRSDCMHFVGRGSHFLRWDLRNCRAGCVSCNQHKNGNIKQFAIKLNEEQPGLASILYEEGNIVYKHSRDEVKQIIKEYSSKVRNLIK